MSDKFHPIPLEQLAEWIFKELELKDSIFGIPRKLFFRPEPNGLLRTAQYGVPMDTPFGVAAGPHSQMAQNIIVAWLCGARFIELKTVQTLDELDVSKPCIDIEDEGYNVEWSQELKIHESFDEYLRAWVLIHVLHRKLGFAGDGPGMIFNMSVGYNLEGILKPNVQWYLDRMHNAQPHLDAYRKIVETFCPEAKDVEIPAQLSDTITLSTMHGCPPDEIEKICAYLLTERGIHTSVKCNPTLLGPDRVRSILNSHLGYEDVIVPDVAFAHDLKYPDAIQMLNNLRARAKQANLEFGVKLSNTLEVENFRTIFDAKEKMMYLSGRPLHAITTHLAAALSQEYQGDLKMSYSAGADAFNVADLLRCGMQTITVCSDILKSGGYLRMLQYVEHTEQAMRDAGATSLNEFIQRTAPSGDSVAACALSNLTAYAESTLTNRLLIKQTFITSKSKTPRKLDLFDCIMAPCVDECPIDQQVPHYMAAVREGRFEDAVEITRADNPLPTILGRVCDHLCENTCIRSHYDEPLAIREMKRFVMDKEVTPRYRNKAKPNGVRVGIIGGGPTGLATAYQLAQAGYSVTIFEAQPYSGGMVSGTIPSYRLPKYSIDQDTHIIEHLGIEIRYQQRAGQDFFLPDLRKEDFKYIVVAVGAQIAKRLGCEGEDCEGVMDALYYLRRVREGKAVALGQRIGVIGAGDTAMDAARSAWRLSNESEISIIYRRTIDQMPADRVEVHCLLEEGIRVHELALPRRVISENGKLKALICTQMKLGERGADGRKMPVEIPNSDFEIPLDTMILAISQNPLFDFFGDEAPELTRKGYIQVDPVTHETSIGGVYAGGDAAMEGPSSIVKGCGDGKRIAAAIRRKEERLTEERTSWPTFDMADLIGRRARREFRVPVPHRPLEDRQNFEEVVLTLSKEDAQKEAARCLDCQKLCSICVGVCPNLAIVTYPVKPFEARLPDLTVQNGRIEKAHGETYRVDQPYQVAVLTDFCNECGNCVTFCPTSGKPYKDKPRLYLNRTEFLAERDNAFMIFRENQTVSMDARFAGDTHHLLVEQGTLHYAGPLFRARLMEDGFVLEEAELTNGSQNGDRLSLRECAAMYVLLKGLGESMPHLPAALKNEDGIVGRIKA